jgi:hypothetical protein
MEDCFQGTSLHLSFSEASQAVNVSFSGGRDVDAYLLETLISVYDRDTWIAEIDILRSMASRRLKQWPSRPEGCSCGSSTVSGPAQLISIDNFAEMIVPPKLPGIIRAKGNWQARLAAASICLAKGYTVVLQPELSCLECLLTTHYHNIGHGSTGDAKKTASQQTLMIV